jgi:hypothetical protein
MSHPFQVGGRYRSRRGPYDVLSVQGNTMRIRYTDGSEQECPVDAMARIYENMQLEEEAPDADDDIGDDDGRIRSVKAVTRAKPRPNPAETVHFDGLVVSDFKSSTAGTGWRKKSSLGGLLAHRLSLLTGQDFQSRPANRRPQVHVQTARSLKQDPPVNAAKFTLWLSASGAYHGFYIEKNDGAMDNAWDWTRFLPALVGSSDLWHSTAAAMAKHGLYWHADVIDRRQNVWEPTRFELVADRLEAHAPDGTRAALDWPEFAAQLAALPADRWCDLYLLQHLTSPDAIRMEARIADHIAQIWRDLAPLYQAGMRVRA